jgi:hypothetical protein
MQLVYPVFIFGWNGLVNEGLQVDFERELVAIIDLEG